jgi:hypothetical protein
MNNDKSIMAKGKKLFNDNKPNRKQMFDFALFAGATYVIVNHGKWLASSLDEMIPSEK